MVYVNLIIGLGLVSVAAFAYFNWHNDRSSPYSRWVLLNERRIVGRLVPCDSKLKCWLKSLVSLQVAEWQVHLLPV